MPRQHGYRFPSIGMPQPNRLVPARAGEKFPVRTVSKGVDAFLMALKGCLKVPCFYIPEPHFVKIATPSDRCAIRAVSQTPQGIRGRGL